MSTLKNMMYIRIGKGNKLCKKFKSELIFKKFF